MATAKTETTHGPTYSMARAVGATACQKRFYLSMPLLPDSAPVLKSLSDGGYAMSKGQR